jgi:hypothetical protein
MIGPLSISNEATSIYSTWFSVSPLGYCDRNFLLGCASGLYFLGAERDECCEDTPLEGAFEFELGSDVRSVFILGGGLGLRDGLEFLDMIEGEREEGKEDREVRRLGPMLPLNESVVVATVSVVPNDAPVGGRCIAFIWTLLLFEE